MRENKKKHHFKSPEARKKFSKTCGFHRGVNPRWQCITPDTCEYKINRANEIELSFLLVEKGWQ